MIQSIRRSYLISIAFSVLVAVGCGDADKGESKVVHSKEDRLRYIEQMEAMERGTEQIMTEQAMEKPTP